MRKECFRQKTVPRTRDNSGVIRHSSDAPTPVRTELPELAFASNFHPSDRHTTIGPVFQIEKDGGVQKRIARIPNVCEPLTPVFHTGFGGGRVGGGGTSKEALQRAKRKAKEQKARSKGRHG